MRALVVPGSMPVKHQAEAEGLDEIFSAAGFEWREPGCSMCLGMNPDQLDARRALRLDEQPQLRGAPGQGRPHAPRQPAVAAATADRRPLRDPGGPVADGAVHEHHTGTAIPLDRADVDTDQIIPAE